MPAVTLPAVAMGGALNRTLTKGEIQGKRRTDGEEKKTSKGGFMDRAVRFLLFAPGGACHLHPAPTDYASGDSNHWLKWGGDDNAEALPFDVFYIIPTAYGTPYKIWSGWSAPMTGRRSVSRHPLAKWWINTQASAFDQRCRVFAPNYRQVSERVRRKLRE